MFCLQMTTSYIKDERAAFLHPRSDEQILRSSSAARISALCVTHTLWPASHSCVDAGAVPGGAQVLPLLHIHTCVSVANETASWNWLVDLPWVNPARPAQAEMEHLDQCKGGPVTSSFNIRHPHTHPDGRSSHILKLFLPFIWWIFFYFSSTPQLPTYQTHWKPAMETFAAHAFSHRKDVLVATRGFLQAPAHLSPSVETRWLKEYTLWKATSTPFMSFRVETRIWHSGLESQRAAPRTGHEVWFVERGWNWLLPLQLGDFLAQLIQLLYTRELPRTHGAGAVLETETEGHEDTNTGGTIRFIEHRKHSDGKPGQRR